MVSSDTRLRWSKIFLEASLRFKKIPQITPKARFGRLASPTGIRQITSNREEASLERKARSKEITAAVSNGEPK